MPEIIHDRAIVTDHWTHLSDDQPIPAGADIIVSLSRFLEDPDTLLVGEGRLGVELRTGDRPEDIAPWLDRISLVAIRFPKFTDGRGYSLARLLRMRHGWNGQLRATGDVLPDQLYYLHRCGFDAFEVRADKDIATAVRALDAFSVTYQGAEDGGLPLYRHRLAATTPLRAAAN